MLENTLSAEMPEVAEPAQDVTEPIVDVEPEASEEEGEREPEPAAPDDGETGESRESAEGQKATADQAPRSSSDTEGGSAKRSADQAFAKMRRELAEKEAKLRRLTETTRRLGFTGRDPDEIADAAEAHFTGKSVEEIRQARMARQQQQSEVQAMAAQLQQYQMKEVQQKMEADLAAIRKLDPGVKSLDDLGPEYFRLIQAGVSGEIAYRAVKGQQESTKAAPPQKIGKVNAKTKAEKDFFTPEEVDKLSPAELDDPKTMEKVMKSMTKW